MEIQKLRNGYTTGACAAAAAKAAAVFMLTGEMPEQVRLRLPDGELPSWNPVPAAEPELRGFWKVIKDAGDDPDVTNGISIYARVTEISPEAAREAGRGGSGYWLEAYPNLYLDGGCGIGKVTKPGLSCPVGHYAINPAPRRMILSAVHEVCRQTGYEGGLLVGIAIPEGTALAEKTFNPRLGITGGISVLGTSGIVRPMSEEALLETIRLDIRMKTAEGKELLIMSPGNYGERFLADTLGISMGNAVICSNFVMAAVRMAVEAGNRRLLFAGHVGKLVKVAAGMPDTHSRYGDRRMETMEAVTRRVWGKEDRLCRQILEANTTEEAVEILKAYHLAEAVLTEIACMVKRQLEQWAKNRLEAEAIVFSSVHRAAGMTAQAQAFAERWKTSGER